MWPDNRVLDLFNIELPIIQAPMAGSALSDMAIAVSEAGGLGSLPCALLSVEQARAELELIRRKTSRPINVNFLLPAPSRQPGSRNELEATFGCLNIQLGVDNNTAVSTSNRASFDDKMCDLVMEFHPEVVAELAQSKVIRGSASCRTDIARAVGKYASTHKKQVSPLKAIALDRGLATACIGPLR